MADGGNVCFQRYNYHTWDVGQRFHGAFKEFARFQEQYTNDNLRFEVLSGVNRSDTQTQLDVPELSMLFK